MKATPHQQKILCCGWTHSAATFIWINRTDSIGKYFQISIHIIVQGTLCRGVNISISRKSDWSKTFLYGDQFAVSRGGMYFKKTGSKQCYWCIMHFPSLSHFMSHISFNMDAPMCMYELGCRLSGKLHATHKSVSQRSSLERAPLWRNERQHFCVESFPIQPFPPTQLFYCGRGASETGWRYTWKPTKHKQSAGHPNGKAEWNGKAVSRRKAMYPMQPSLLLLIKKIIIILGDFFQYALTCSLPQV